ncbi:MAG: prolyl aminopeptidase [Proteobacteria bacterium]|nr:MAG: prolyl aminopeptidase [Pseudomonadota bacterium]
MSDLYPAISENHHFMLAVDDIHTLYVEESGTVTGIPVVYLHGGPGTGSSTFQRRLFDPERYRIVSFDQRGAGRSTPHAETRNNTTQDLVADMEKVREALNIEQWVVSGGSWGSTLALTYAQTHPERVLGLIVRGIFLGSKAEVEWFYQDGASRFFPEYWEDFLAPIPQAEQSDLVTAYHRRLHGENEIARMGAAKAWAAWEAHALSINPTAPKVADFSEPHIALSVACLESHYFMNNCFLEDGQLLKNADVLQDIPGTIIHGRYDMICQPQQAYNLHKAWPTADYFIVQAAGHTASDLGITSALITAGNDMLRKLA